MSLIMVLANRIGDICFVFVLFLILLALVLLITWILLTPIVVQADTRIPAALVQWGRIGGCRFWFDGEWKLAFRILFFRKTLPVATLKGKRKKPRTHPQKKKKKGPPFGKIIQVLRSFRVEAWQLAVDTGDYTRNAKLYPFNHAPVFREHLWINFTGENYLYLRIRNRPGRILWAWIRK